MVNPQMVAKKNNIRFVDLFCGIGGFRYGIEKVCRDRDLASECVFSSDIDESCKLAYKTNFGHAPAGDITKIAAGEIPEHDILLAGFPCQPFSIIGQMRGFEDTRGTLFFDIARIIKAKQPEAFVLENVKLLKGHDNGRTLATIVSTLENLGYRVDYKILNALDFGLPQKRERIWIVGFRSELFMEWPLGGVPMLPLSKLLEKKVDRKHFASDYIREKRHKVMKPGKEPTIWHENKAGNISAYPFSCALRAGASYNYLLVDGERRLTPREMLRLQGFPESFEIACSDSQTRKQAGNSLPVNVAHSVLNQVFHGLDWGTAKYSSLRGVTETRMFSEPGIYEAKAKAKA